MEIEKGFLLDGFSPWVTGATQADTIVVGAEFGDGRQILIVVPTHIPGVKIDSPDQLVAFSSSHTSRVNFEQVEVDAKWLLAGPTENVMSRGIGARTGGYQTCTLALGLAGAAIEFMIAEGRNRQVRRMTAAVGLPTLRLVRTSIGHFQLDQLQPGEFKEVIPEGL